MMTRFKWYSDHLFPHQLKTPSVKVGPPLTKLMSLAAGGAQWLSCRMLDSRPKGRGFEPHRRHCVVVLEQDTFILA